MNVPWEECGWERLTRAVGRLRLPGWDATTGLVAGNGAALLYDTGSALGEGAGLRAQAQRLLGGRHVTHIALSHPHFDHVLGTAAFSGAEVYGAVGVAELLAPAGRGRADLYEDAVREGLDPARAAEAVDLLVLPRHAVSGELTLDLGGRQVLLANVGPGHTAHDLALLVPAAGPDEPEVVFCGDLVEESGTPQAGRDAIPSHWPAALDRLLELGGEEAVYVPGHGSVVDAGFVRRQRDELARRFGLG
ncbi:MBL fold metallo-hydrolase [Streptomyces sp. NRRL F-5135]|uniref:MBL fold metallo-hydrolase n=1 Tax=Streptomyces sp. NRRL F-5135 TaxID=1463858 RepID=UPI0004CA487A|nr:MBL fold metallo-hydrolase [Streptomyces sp. NRRL F-5135]